MKELRFHPQFACLMATTAEDSFNVFRPNLEPVEESQPTATAQENVAMSATNTDEETKQGDTSSADEESKR